MRRPAWSRFMQVARLTDERSCSEAVVLSEVDFGGESHDLFGGFDDEIEIDVGLADSSCRFESAAATILAYGE